MVFFLLYISTMIDTQSIIEAASFEEEVENSTLKCHKRLYNYSVSQVDQNGKKCWDILSVMACWGRCDSNEVNNPPKNLYILIVSDCSRSSISDFHTKNRFIQFACITAEIRLLWFWETATKELCHQLPGRPYSKPDQFCLHFKLFRYEYYEAADCKCQQCSSLDTSCEGLRYRSQRSEPDRGFRRIIRGRDLDIY